MEGGHANERWGSHQLEEVLSTHGVDYSMWGKGEAKQFHHLLAELNAGESHFELSDEGELRRVIAGVWLDVIHQTAEGTVWSLVETKQVFADGRTRRRASVTSLGEKLKPNELPEQAVYRGLREELGVRAVTGLYYTGENEAVVESRDYPGLGLRLTRYDYVATIPPQEFCSDGYVEA